MTNAQNDEFQAWTFDNSKILFDQSDYNQVIDVEFVTMTQILSKIGGMKAFLIGLVGIIVIVTSKFFYNDMATEFKERGESYENIK